MIIQVCCSWGMKRPSPRESRIPRKQTVVTMALMMAFHMRTLFVLATTCLAVLSAVRYCHFANSSEGIAPSIHESQLQQQQPVESTTSSPATPLKPLIKQPVGTRALCRDRYVYIHSIPREYNEQLLEECRILRDWSDMCSALKNAGLGPAMSGDALFTPTGWYETNQFALEVIFHNRLKLLLSFSTMVAY